MVKNILIKKLFIFVLFIVLFIIFLSSLLSLYEKRYQVLDKLGIYSKKTEALAKAHGHNENRFLINPLAKSDRQLPPDKIEDLIIDDGAETKGQWSAPFDWNVTAIHSILLPDETVMTFGSYAIEKKENEKDLISNKKLVLTDGREIERDSGSHQWDGHDVNSAFDIDIWDYKKGVGDNAHTLFKKPIIVDSFCSVVRVINSNEVFIVGGNKNPGGYKSGDPGYPDNQNATTIYDIGKKKFRSSNKLNYKRWYASAVITGDEKMVIMGGKDITNDQLSIIPEILDLNKVENGWSLLKKAESEELFGNIKNQREWSYPRSFLASDGNIVGISYNKIWVMDKNDNFRIRKTAEIPLEEGGVAAIIEHIDPNSKDSKPEKLKTLTVGSPVGDKNSVVMIEKDKLLVTGGLQNGEEYSGSNKVFLIDFSDSFNPKISKLSSVKYPRVDGDSVLLPNGKIFISGGTAFDNLKYSIFIPEIYDPNTEISIEQEQAHFRRNYHSSSLLLPDGRILIAGGDVWNAEIFYPPYLFTKNINNKTVLAKRPKIINVNKNLNRGENFKIEVEGEISRTTLISTGTTTHAQGSEPKFRNLNFKVVSQNEVEIEIDENINNIQNGMYLLFVLNSSGVPSEGKIVQIN